MTIRFEWDERKNETNFWKHGVMFEEAATVFLDEEAVLIADPDDEEERFIIRGRSNKSRLLLVCHCYRETDSVIRIISARRLSKKEQSDYLRAST